MKYAGNFSGSSMVIKKYKASAAQAIGTIVLRSAANAVGQFSTSTTTSFADSLGVCIDNGLVEGAQIAFSTVQNAPEAVYSVIVNPDAILRAQMVTGATGVAVTADAIATATPGGTTTIGAVSVAAPSMDEGMVWYISGSNVGKSRKIISVSTTTATVGVPFSANAIGDQFCYAGLNIGLTGITLTNDLQNVRTDIAVSTGGSATVLDLELGGILDSYVTFVLADQVFNVAT